MGKLTGSSPSLTIEEANSLIATIEQARVVVVGNVGVTQSMADDKANGKQFADALLTLGVDAPETETAVNNIINFYHALANAADDPDIIGITGNQRDYWRLVFDVINGVTLGTFYGVNWTGWTFQRFVEVYGQWATTDTQRSTINWIGFNNIEP